MKPGAAAAGLAAFFGVGTLLWLPLGAPAVQTLMEQNQAAAVSAGLDSQAQASGAGSLGRVKRILGALQTLVDEVEKGPPSARRPVQAPRQAPAAPAAPAADVLPPRLLAEPKAPASAKGRIFMMEGTVTAVDRIDGRTYYRLKPDHDLGLGNSDSLLVEVPLGEASEGAVGQRVRAFGAFSRLESSRSGSRLFAFVQGQMVSRLAPGASPAPAAAAAPAPSAAPAFTGPLNGWSLEGTVTSEAGGTAVVVSPEGSPLFLSPGQSFGAGIRLVEVRTGEAVFSRSGEAFSVTAG